MATKKGTNKETKARRTYGTPKYPYVYTPTALDRFMKQISEKPTPGTVDYDLLKAWGFNNSNDKKITTVLKEIKFLDGNGSPTENYIAFKSNQNGSEVLGKYLQDRYDKLFTTVSNYNNPEELHSFFNTFGGGGEDVVKLQVRTFQALANHATFGSSDPLSTSRDDVQNNNGSDESTPKQMGTASAAIHIDLHIHLPENKSKGEYDSILESIANHIYNRRAHE